MGKLARKHLRKLTPFLNDNHLLRVGGRLGYAEIPYNEKHPLFRRLYSPEKHPGLQTVQYLLRKNYWILNKAI